MPSGRQKTEQFISGYAAIIGRPNVGKSTFLNAVLGQKVSIVSPKPQTTRNRIIGIKTLPEAQIVFVDTPGIHTPKHGLGAAMVRTATNAIRDVDVVLYMVEPHLPGPEEGAVIKLFRSLHKPVLLLVNKTDKVKKPVLLPVIEAYAGAYPFDEVLPISALRDEGLGLVLEKIKGFLQPGPKYYPEELVTDRLERFLVAEAIREKIIMHTHEEVPHSVAVEVTDWEERPGGMVAVGANIYVEKESQKGIIIGKKGATLKAVGTAARRDIQRLLGTKVHLSLWVKVKKRWRDNASALTELGLD